MDKHLEYVEPKCWWKYTTFQPAFGVPSTQTAVEIFNSSHDLICQSEKVRGYRGEGGGGVCCRQDLTIFVRSY